MQLLAQKIYKHFGSKQELKAKEEWIELEIAKLELEKHDIKCEQGFYDKDIIIDTVLQRMELIDKCNEELADNVLLCMQIRNCDFEEGLERLLFGNGYNWLNVDKVRKTVQEKIDRTIKKYGIEV